MAIKLKLELKWTKIKRVVTLPRGLNLEDLSDIIQAMFGFEHDQPSQHIQPQPTSAWHGRSHGNLMRTCFTLEGCSMTSSAFSRTSSR